jgi:hypothetical protein
MRHGAQAWWVEPSPDGGYHDEPIPHAGSDCPAGVCVQRLARCPGLAAQVMWRWTFSVLAGPGTADATQGPGIDGSMMPSSSHE